MNAKEPTQVEVENLTPEMVIQAITRFSPAYRPMDLKRVQWVKHNFSGCTLEIQRDSKNLKIAPQDLQVEDHLMRVSNFPPGFKPFQRMQPALFQELQKKGLLGFEVRKKAKTKSKAEETHAAEVDYAQSLLEQFSQGKVYRSKLANEVRDCFSKVNQGKIHLGELDDITAQVLINSSTEALLAVASLQGSEQTYAHSIDVGAIYLEVYRLIMSRGGAQHDPSQEREVLLGGFLHDIGKAKIPQEILENTTRFAVGSREMQMMQSHSTHSRDILSAMELDKVYCDMAYHHHVKMDEDLVSSYPKNVKYKDLSFESKLLGIVDVYQALIGKRKYKKPWCPAEAISYLDNLAGVEFGDEIWQIFLKVVGLYPVGSLVQLSDGSQGFVMKAPQEELDRPSLALVANAKGERLSHNSLINLEKMRDLKIAKHLRPEDQFGDQAADIFASLKVC